MDSWAPWRWALVGPLWPRGRLSVSGIAGVLLVSWMLRLTGGISVEHTGLPIVASLANKTTSFSCRINHQDKPELQGYTVSYFHEDLQGRRSSEKTIVCEHTPGAPNHTIDCQAKLKPPNASATGTYHCCLRWMDLMVQGSGIFILVRDTGYLSPPLSPKKDLLFGFVGLLGALSVLGTALLLWKKKRRLVPVHHPTKMCENPKNPPAEALYTSLQRRETEVYAFIESETGSPPCDRRSCSQEKRHGFEEDGDFNMVYENL